MAHLIAILIIAAAAPFIFRAVDYFAVLVYLVLLTAVVLYTPKLWHRTAEAQKAQPSIIAQSPTAPQNTSQHTSTPQNTSQHTSADANPAKLECERREHQPCELFGGTWLAPRQFKVPE